MARVGPGGSWRTLTLAAIALVSAGPTLVWAFTGARLMHDDWGLADSFAQGDLVYRWSQFWLRATEAPARPGGAVYYALSYAAFGMRPVLHALLLALVNGVLGILLFLVAERLWRTDIAFWIAMVYAALPNRGSTRLWFAVGNYPLAVVLLLGGVLLLLRGRPLVAASVLAAGVLTYEGIFALALLAVAVWVLADLAKRWRTGLMAMIPILAASALLFFLSPKRKGLAGVGGFDRLVSSQFGVGTFEWPNLARITPLVLLVGLAIIVALPHEHRDRYRRVVLAGFVILLAGWAPFFLTNWAIATDGFFDRANGVVGLGTAVVMGAFLAWVTEVAPNRVGMVAGMAVVALLLGLNAVDVRAFRQAAQQGDALVAQVVVDVPPGSKPLRVVPPPEPVRGVAQFPAGSNLSDAVHFRRGDRVVFWIDPTVEEAPLPPDAACYDRVARVITACAAHP